MEIVYDCWSSIETYNCQYGAHLFDGSTAKIYVNHWLDVDGNLRSKFVRRNDAGFVGHCVLVFKGVRKFQFEVLTNSKEADELVWSEPISFNYTGTSTGAMTKYYLEGSLHGFASSVSIRVEAEGFELHILGKDEPAKES